MYVEHGRAEQSRQGLAGLGRRLGVQSMTYTAQASCILSRSHQILTCMLVTFLQPLILSCLILLCVSSSNSPNRRMIE